MVPGLMNSVNVFELKTIQTSVIKTMIDALKEILTDANIEFHPGDSNAEDENARGSIKIITMDPTQTVLVHLKLDGKYFEYYRCSRRTIIGVSMLNLNKLIKTMTNNDTLTLFLAENDPNKLGILIENSDKNSVTMFKMNLMDLPQDRVNIPNQEFENVITMPSVDFQKIIRDMSNLSETIEIQNIGSRLHFSCKGEFADQETILTENGGVSFSNNTEKSEVIQGYYNLKYLVLFTKCTNLSNNITIFMKNDFPLIIQYKVGSLGNLKLALAPKVQTGPNV
jgi:proliferating cell nuclear antigen